MIATDRSRFLELNQLGALANMRFTTKHRIEGSYSGRHRSRQHGGAGEFVDHREYVEGEDLRQLDWKVLARTGRAYLRTYQEETNLCCTLVVDGSSSMSFGADQRLSHHTTKLEYAQYFSTALSYLIAKQQDQIGLAIIADGLKAFLPPGGTQVHALQIQEAIHDIQPEPVTNLSDGLRDAFTRLARRGVLLILSDFLLDDLESAFSAVRLFRHRHWEVVVLHLVHPDEERLPSGLAYRFEGLEGEGLIDCSPEEIKTLYTERFSAHCRMVRKFALAIGCDYHRVSTAVPYLQTLGKFLVERTG